MRPPAHSPRSCRYIADPRLEDGGSENASKPRKTVVEVMGEVCGKGGVGGSWSGIAGNDKIPSDGEWQDLLGGESGEGGKGARSFMYYGPGRCLARFTTDKLCSLNIDGCNLVVLADRAENDASYRRQSKLDNQKRSGQLGLEQSLESAALLSLAGANCVVMHRWGGSFQMLGEFVKGFSEGLGKGKPVWECLADFKGKQMDGRALKTRVQHNVVCVGLPHMQIGN